MYNKYNFYRNTYCEFKEVPLNTIELLASSYKSKSGSVYYFTDFGVYRYSNHWGRAARCKWKLIDNKCTNSRTKLGFAQWTDFLPENSTEKLYCIAVDFQEKKAHYYHKQSSFYSGTEIARNASETTKLLKQIRVLLTEQKWLKHLDVADSDIFRKQIIEEQPNTMG